MFNRIITGTKVFDRPKVGDIVKVAVGFSSYLNEGIVESVYDEYCWISQYTSSGKYLRSFTASFSYCKFYKLN
jgi:hypothetical protein